MRFGLIHRIMIDLLVVIGILSLLTSGELNPWMATGISVVLLFALLVPERYEDTPVLRRAGIAVSLSTLAIQLWRLAIGEELLPLAVEFAAALQVIRLLTRRGAAYDQQIILLALVHLVAGTVLGGGLAYGLCFLGFLVVAPAALVLSHLRREVEGNYRQGARDRTGLPVDVPRILKSRRVISRKFLLATCSLSIPVFLFTAILFVLFPRVGLSLLLMSPSHSQRMIGFSDQVSLGGVGKLRSDPTIAMRVYPKDLAENPPERIALYLRGAAFDQYDGFGWARTIKGRVPADQNGTVVWLGPRTLNLGRELMTIDLESLQPPIVFLPPKTHAIRLQTRGTPPLGRMPNVFAGPEQQFDYDSLDDRGLRYQVFDGPRYHLVLSNSQRQRYLTLPDDLTPRIAALAKSWVGNESSPRKIAELIEKRLQADYKYDLESPSGGAPNPLDHFLFESKRGHCEFYSTAMAIMLRTLGIPSRNVAGFVGGTYNRFGEFYAVRQGDAHSWVEAYFKDRGWERFDPTPPASSAPVAETGGFLPFVRDLVEAASQRWTRHVVGYDLQQQVQMLRNISQRYGPFGKSSSRGVDTASSKRLMAIVLGLGMLSAAVAIWYRARRRPRGGPSPTSAAQVAQLQAVQLYKTLEAAMAARGVPRRIATPPLGHVQALLAIRHPIAAEAHALTVLYLEARFGDRQLTASERAQFAARVEALRTPPPADRNLRRVA
ncbi:MAG TPA: transglutaminaseTgpA domain-containing protein [Polyangiaceae bacterium]|nr:transglutaminaseTgpA domain-containing protein [Polyangiaceae bacterium]